METKTKVSQVISRLIQNFLEMHLKQGLISGENLKKIMQLTLVLCVIAGSSYAQKKNAINYFNPESVSTKILTYLQSEKKGLKHFAFLHYQNDTTFILISRYPTFAKLDLLVKNTNRYLRIDSSTAIPIIFETDLVFSNSLHYISANKGGAYETFSHTSINLGGYSITYKGLYQESVIIGTADKRL